MFKQDLKKAGNPTNFSELPTQIETNFKEGNLLSKTSKDSNQAVSDYIECNMNPLNIDLKS